MKTTITSLIALLTIACAAHAQVVVRYIDSAEIQRQYEASVARHHALLKLKHDIRIEQEIYKCWKEVNAEPLWRLKFSNGGNESPGLIYQNMRVNLASYPSFKTPEEVAILHGHKLPMPYPLKTIMP
jgi:hypothetical protein